jgi:S-adenosylmethionine:tRNA ribosyltransferase-isomerase
VRNAKRVKINDRIDFGSGVSAIATERYEDGSILLEFEGDEPVETLLEKAGRMPLPPYIAGKRAADAQDRADYQTMFANEPGAVAAPTAALHFTPELMARLEAAGIEHATLTLHVGAGTFLPVKADDTVDHKMHAEWGRIDAATAERLNAIRARGNRLIAVGTTSLRLLESAAGEDEVIRPFEGDTAIFITPGYRFRAIDGLVTNFHLPRSTLFMLVSALMGRETMQATYAHAIRTGYRFYSYGDASLLLPAR